MRSAFRMFKTLVLILIWSWQPSFAAPGDNWIKIIPLEELDGPQSAGGQITVDSLKAIEVALPELSQYDVKIEQYRTITVQRTEHAYHVTFTRMELYSPNQGSLPGTPQSIIVRVERETYKVTGSAFW